MAVCARFRVLSGGGFGLGFGGGGCKAVSDETDETLKPQADCPELPNATLQPAPPPPAQVGPRRQWLGAWVRFQGLLRGGSEAAR